MPQSANTLTVLSWFPVFMLLLGSAITVFIGAVENRRTLKRDREAREDARRDKLLEHRNDFQRECLLQLQEAMFELGRATTLLHMHDMRHYARTGEWQLGFYPDEMSEKDRGANQRTAMLVVRVRDDKVRKLVQEFKEIAGRVTTFSESKDGSETEMRLLYDKHEELNPHIGKLLRTMHDEETKLLESPGR